MRVLLGGGQARVTQQLLDGTQVGSPVEQMGRECVAQRVRRNRPGEPYQTGFPQVALHYGAHGSVGKASTPGVQKNGLRVPAGPLDAGPDPEPGAQRVGCDLTERDHPLLATLSEDPEDPVVRVEVGEVETDQFRHPQSRSVQEFENGEIAAAERRGWIRGVQQGLDLVQFHARRNPSGSPRRLEGPRRVRFHRSRTDEIPVERTQSRQLPRYRRAGQTALVKRAEVGAQHTGVNL